MKTITLVAALALTPFMGFALPACQSTATQEEVAKTYIEADRATYEAIVPELEQWLEQEDQDSQEVKEVRAALAVWKDRLENAESYPWIAYVNSDLYVYDTVSPVYESLMFKHIEDQQAQVRRLITLQTWEMRIENQQRLTEVGVDA